jgi:hypothetical protein
MKPYTVVLLRNDKFAERPDAEEFGKDSYIAHVTADDELKAVSAAKKEVLNADNRDMRGWMGEMQICTGDYIFVVLFDGHVQPKYFGWQE